MISRFFIDHPIFASVISIIITLAGLAAMKALPIEQYPNITPPLIQVTTSYNGANAEVMANDVASPLEQNILGAEDMIYMYSQNASSGYMTLDVYFSIGSNANMDQVNVQNLVNQSMSMLPEAVQKEGVTITKQTPNILLIVALQSPSGRYTQDFVSNYANINIVNDLLLLPGISNISVIGQRNYSMRVWLRPDLMAELGITASDVINAIDEQNADYGIGQMGQAPNVHPVVLTVPMQTKGRLSTPEEFENIIIKAELDGSAVLLKDIGSVQLGAQNYSVDGSIDGEPTILLAVYQEYGANALDVAQSIQKKMDKISENFPEGLEYSIPYNTTLFIQESISEVVKTIFIAALLVILVVFIFLQNLRATLIPIIALIVAIIGAFSGMYVLGFSINTLTLFGMVLAIGIVVDDAIVVVENVERNMRAFNLSPVEASKRAMDEVTGPIIAIVFVLCSVFIPIAFLGGIAGQLYKQFAMTIAISVIFSGIVALSLSPALAALIIKPRTKENWLAAKFNQGLAKITDWYIDGARLVIGSRIVSFGIFGGILLAIGVFFYTTPTSLVPNEDQGYIIALNTMPDAASLDRTQAVDNKISELANKHPGVEGVISLTGFSLIESLNRTTIGSNFIMLKGFDQRKSADLSAFSLIDDFQKEFYMGIQDSSVFVVNPPAIPGLGTVGGFEFWIENRGDGGDKALQEAIEAFITKAKERPELTPLQTTMQFDNLQFDIDLDRYKAKALGVSVGEVFETLQTLLGAVYVNNFNKFGRVYQVIVQADPSFRERIETIGDMYVRSSNNKMVPLNSLITIKPTNGPNLVSRFNDFPAAEILGGPSKGYTTGQAISAMEEVAKAALPPSMNFGWSGEAYQEIATGGTSTVVLIAGLIMVFLILSALYEMWSLPLAVLMAVPFGIFGAFVAIWLLGMNNDVYFQIGLVTIIALSAKNAILIVEFAAMKADEGLSKEEAALTAAKLRFRAILMTSLTFIFGVMPLVFASGAGAASRHSVGVGVLGGMIAATSLALFFVPFFFKLFYKEKKR